MHRIHRLGSRALGLSLLAAAVAIGVVGSSAEATLFFTDDFAYSNGDLAGNAGGTGWQAGSLWTGGAGSTGNQVANPLPGTSGKSIQISSNTAETTRPLGATYTSGGTTTYYISFAFNASPFQGFEAGQYAGVSVFLAADRSNNLFAGMPGSSGALGFDWTNRFDPSASGANGTTYLALLEIKPGTAANTTNVNMFVTTDLLMSGAALAASTPWVAAGDDPDFSFDSVGISGSYTTGTISIAGLAMADNPNEAVSFTQTAVPEPATAVLLGAAAAGILAVRCRPRKIGTGVIFPR
jgi:hypothetical protein